MILNEGPKDSRGRHLQEGDEVLIAIPGPIYFRVAEITPILDKNAPAGMFNLHLATVATFTVKGGASHKEFIRVQTRDEAGPNPFKVFDQLPDGGRGDS